MCPRLHGNCLQEFEYWLKRNPKILDSLLSFKTKEKECTLGPLIMSPSEQLFSASQQPTSLPDKSVPLVVTMKAASPTLFQVGDPSEGLLSPDAEDKEMDVDSQAKQADQETEGNGFKDDPDSSIDLAQPDEHGEGREPATDQGQGPSTSQPPSINSAAAQGRSLTDGSVVVGQESGDDNITVASEDLTDQAGSIMLAESNVSLSIDMSCVTRSASSDKLGSPVLPTTSLEEVAMTTEEPQSDSLLMVTNQSAEKEVEPSDDAPPTFVAEDLKRVEDELEGVHLTPSISDSVPDVTIDLQEGVEEGEEQVFLDEEVPESLTPSITSKEMAKPAESLAEFELVPEEIYTAWLPSPKTQEVLNQSQPSKDPSYLTCPALVADVRMVSEWLLSVQCTM